MSDETMNVGIGDGRVKPAHNAVQLNSVNAGEIFRITPDGVMKFKVEANDENAKQFVECVEAFIGRRLTGVEVSESGIE